MAKDILTLQDIHDLYYPIVQQEDALEKRELAKGGLHKHPENIKARQKKLREREFGNIDDHRIKQIIRLLEMAHQEDQVRPQSYLLEGFTLLWLMRHTYDNLGSRIHGRKYEWIAYYEQHREECEKLLATPRSSKNTFANQGA